MNIEPIFGEIPDNWVYSLLGQACKETGGNIQTGPFGSQLHQSDYVQSGIPSIMPKNITDHGISEIEIARISSEAIAKISSASRRYCL